MRPVLIKYNRSWAIVPDEWPAYQGVHVQYRQVIQVEWSALTRGARTRRGFTGEGELMTLTFIAALEAEDDHDRIRITGKPDLEVTLKGTNGDIAAIAIAAWGRLRRPGDYAGSADRYAGVRVRAAVRNR